MNNVWHLCAVKEIIQYKVKTFTYIVGPTWLGHFGYWQHQRSQPEGGEQAGKQEDTQGWSVGRKREDEGEG